MTDSILAVLREQEARSRASRMSKQEKSSYLKRSGWQNSDNNRWRHRSGTYAPFASAVLVQLLADRDGSP